MKKVLITGANKSIGYETARQLAQHGYFIFITARDVERGEKAIQQLKAEGLNHVAFVQMDITSPESVKSAFEAVSAQTTSLDVLINNAGISGGFPQPATSYPAENVLRVFQTNFFGVINVTQTFLPLLKTAPAPRIVNVTSGIGSLTYQSNPNWEYYALKGAAYGPSKTALNAYTIALAYDLKDLNFKVNAVDPGYTATDFNNYRGYKTVASGGSTHCAICHGW
ncbi:MAG TPA: SDR family oxidoreductase [Chitinophagaceae bacterium]|nr:SDR family oxidoreductase [Chitinophagaceae bacterium]